MSTVIATSRQAEIYKPLNEYSDIAPAKGTDKTSQTSAIAKEKIKGNAVEQTMNSPITDVLMPALTKPVVEANSLVLRKALEDLGGAQVVALLNTQKNSPQMTNEKTNAIELNPQNLVQQWSDRLTKAMLILVALAQSIIKADAQNKSALMKVQHTLGYASANSLKEAGIQQLNKDLSSNLSQITMSVVGSVVEGKGLNKAKKAHVNYGNKQIELRNQSALLKSQAVPTKPRAMSDAQDSKILLKTANNKMMKAEKQGNLLETSTLSARKMQTKGQAISGTAHSVGQVAASPYTVEHAEKQAESQRYSTDQTVTASAVEMKGKKLELNEQLLAILMTLLASATQDRNATISTMVKI